MSVTNSFIHSKKIKLLHSLVNAEPKYTVNVKKKKKKDLNLKDKKGKLNISVINSEKKPCDDV